MAFLTEENKQFQAFYPVIVDIVFRFKVILPNNFDLIFYGNLNAGIKSYNHKVYIIYITSSFLKFLEIQT